MRKPNRRRYVTHVRNDKINQMGRLPTLGEIYVQQWLANFSLDEPLQNIVRQKVYKYY